MSRKTKTRERQIEFFTNILELGIMTRDQYLAEMKAGLRSPSATELKEIEAEIEIVRKELEKLT